ncbi:MAG: Histone acetyltransferase [Frankiales bacterium]|nr:Histone acetyltransferase [Frankiales bacterium]
MTRVSPDDPSRPDVVALLSAHLAFAAATSPPEDVHALDLSGLLDPSVSFFSVRVEEALVAIGALKQLDPSHVEVKSMHTAAAFRGQGFARVMLDHLVSEARSRGCSRISLETGSMKEFAPARTLYGSVGFVECEPFDSYAASPHSTFMTLPLTPSRVRDR